MLAELDGLVVLHDHRSTGTLVANVDVNGTVVVNALQRVGDQIQDNLSDLLWIHIDDDWLFNSDQDDPKAFLKRYEKLLLDQQRNLGLLEPTPIVSLSADAVMEREISHGK